MGCQCTGIESRVFCTDGRYDGTWKLVIREWQKEIDATVSGLFQEICQFQFSVSPDLAVSVETLDAIHRNSEVILAGTSEVLESQFVFNGDDERTARFQKAAYFLQHGFGGMRRICKQCRVFEYADQRHYVKFFGACKVRKTVGNHIHIGKITGSAARDGCTPRAALESQDFGVEFSEVSGDGTAAGADFQNRLASQEFRKRP